MEYHDGDFYFYVPEYIIDAFVEYREFLKECEDNLE